jgi:2-polyprenyl-6-methoxyphenol hydroxylase-like FAD-dependent oxidoreductase
VHGSLPAADVPEALRRELRAVADQRWPSPWREALDVALRDGLIFATPIVQYWPVRLVRGRVVIVGDAAHAASPMVGGGFRQGLYDTAALVDAFDHGGDRDGPGLLTRYEPRRLFAAQTHVERSQSAGAAYLARQDRC